MKKLLGISRGFILTMAAMWNNNDEEMNRRPKFYGSFPTIGESTLTNGEGSNTK